MLSDTDQAAGRAAVEWARLFAERYLRLAKMNGVQFALLSTRRQLNRYATGVFSTLASESIKSRANAALAALPPETT